MAPKSKISKDVEYTLEQLPVSDNTAGMSFIISSSEGLTFVIDGGSAEDAEKLEEYIVANHSGEVDAWFITGAVPGAAGALVSILKSKTRRITVKKVVYSHIPSTDLEKWDTKSAMFAEEFNAVVRSFPCQKINVRNGERIKLETALVRVFSAPDRNRSNEASVVYKFNLCSTSVLFLADIGYNAGIAMLETYKGELSCDILQLPLSTYGDLPEDVYQIASPDLCLWCADEDIFDRDDSAASVRALLDRLGATEHRLPGDGGGEIKISL